MFSRLKPFVKEKIYHKLGLPYSHDGVPASISKYLPKNTPITLVDIGAHDGWFTLALDKYCGVSQGLLIEPLPHKSNNLRQIFISPTYSVLECVLSNKSGDVELEVNEAEATSSILNIKRSLPELSAINLGKPKTIKCEAMTLDEVLCKYIFSKIDLIKIDVQGAEHLVIKGGLETLKITNMIWIEISFKPLYEGSSVFADIYFLLTQAGFGLIEIEPGFRAPNGELLQSDALFAKL
ncbi:MAG: FkbM family methyltransferase [Nostoc sp.]|uniref:FkbM family methyltransferase n=1 Tax=Nostoc sp. TaxID=1180 RepID=UPI002FEF90BD